jgi:potassium-transporting ATPase KdpC subunit
MRNLWKSIRMLICLTLLTGIIYPLALTGLAFLTMRFKAEGSFVKSQGKAVGSALIAQKFQSTKYFWARPSANDYNGLSSGGSNLGPTSALLKKTIQERQTLILQTHQLSDPDIIPSELLYASGSGLDPHISPKAAYFQLERVVKARGLNEKINKKSIFKLIHAHIEKPLFNFIGSPRVNVLLLNIALDKLESDLEPAVEK